MIHITGTPADLAQPAVLFGNVLAGGALVASSTAAGTYAANALGPQTYDYWEPAALPATLAVTLAAAAECDGCGIVAHDLGTKGATVFVERWSAGAWVTVASAAPADDAALLMIWPAVSSTQWRIRVTGAAAPALGVVMIGKRLVLPGGVQPPYVPADAARRVEAMTSITLGGHYAGASIFRGGLENEAALAPMDRAFVEGDLADFRDHYDRSAPFFFAACPAALARDVAYVWRADGAPELRPAYDAGALYASFTMKVAGYGA